MTALAAFPARPPYQAGEGLAGYLYRAYDANGHRLPAALLRALDRSYVEVASLDALINVVGNATTVREAWLPVAQMRRRAGSASRLLLGPVGRLAYCPACMRGEPVHRWMWQLPGVWVCEEHVCRLVDRCPACNTWCTWRNCRLDWSCSCGASLFDCEIQEAAVHELFVAQMLRESLAGGNEESARDLYVSLADGAKLLTSAGRSRGRDCMLEGARLLHDVLSDRSAVAAELFNHLHKTNGFFGPVRPALRRVIEWAEDTSQSASLLREEIAAGLRSLLSTHRVQLTLDRPLLYTVRPIADRVAELQAFGIWCDCWDGSAGSSRTADYTQVPAAQRWDLRDDVIAEIVADLYRAFQRGDDSEVHLARLSAVTSDVPKIVWSAEHVVASLWSLLRTVPLVHLRPYLTALRSDAAEGLTA